MAKPAAAMVQKAGAARAEPVTLAAAMDLRDSLAAVLANCAGQVGGNIAMARQSGDPEAIHQLRVGLRRMRAALSVFKDALAPPARKAAADGLERLEHEAGAAREWDVLIDAIGKAIWGSELDPRAIARLLDAAEARREDARDRARGAIGRADVEGLLDRAKRLVARGDDASLARTLRPFAVDVLEARDRKIRKAGRRLRTLHARELHRLRIRIKKLRYASEFFAALWPGPAAQAYIKRLKRLQDRLGDIQDMVSARRLIRDLGRERRSLAGEAGAVRRWARHRRKSCRRRLAKPWRKFERAERFWRARAGD